MKQEKLLKNIFNNINGKNNSNFIYSNDNSNLVLFIRKLG